MIIEFTHNGFYITGEFYPGCRGTSEEPGDDPEFCAITIQVEDNDALLQAAIEEYGEL